MDVRRHRYGRERPELWPRPRDLALQEPEAPERPARRVESRREAVGQDGPLLGQELSGRDAMSQRGIDRFHGPTIPRRPSEAFECGGGEPYNRLGGPGPAVGGKDLG